MTYEGFGSSERACLSGNYKPSIFSFQQYYGSGKDASSKLMVEWTNQHGCGGNPKVSCNYVIQVTMVTINNLTLVTVPPIRCNVRWLRGSTLYFL